MATDIASIEPATFRAGDTVEWKPRRWAWVDPLKDTQANVISVANGFKSRRSIVSEAGGDFESTVEEIAQDNALAESKGVELDGDRTEEIIPDVLDHQVDFI